jgi:hypothetical protein
MTSENEGPLAAAAAEQQPKQPKKKGKGGEEGDGEAGEEGEDSEEEEDPEDGFRQPDRIDTKPGPGLQTLPALQTFASQYLWSMKGHPFVLFNDSAKHAGLHHELQSGGGPAAAAGSAGGGGQGLGPEGVVGLKELAERAASTGGGRLGSIMMEQSDLAAMTT